MNACTLSYVMTTYNKVEYLRLTLPLLLEALADDEELVITDGGSSDGTADFLKEALTGRANARFVSEHDQGESHGTNRALLMAKGEVIKIVTDDDLFDFAAIKACKSFMLESDFDVMGGNGASCTLPGTEMRQHDFSGQYRRWLKDRKPMFFSGLSLMIRRSSLPLLGLFHTGLKMIDLEYVLRVTGLPIRMAYYPGIIYCNIVNPQSNSARFARTFFREQVKIDRFYKGKKTNNLQRWRHYLATWLGRHKTAGRSTDLAATYAEVYAKFVSMRVHTEILHG